MKIWILIIIGFPLLITVTSGCYYDNKEELFQFVQEEECIIPSATYANDIVPLLVAHCNRCHRNDRQDGNVNLEGYQHVKPYVDDGSLYGSTIHDPRWPVMPTSGVRIPICEIEKMRIWIENGAPNN